MILYFHIYYYEILKVTSEIYLSKFHDLPIQRENVTNHMINLVEKLLIHVN